MNEQILQAIDEEIARLEQVRSILSSSGFSPARKTAATPAATAEKPKRNLSPKARRAIAEAQHKRWAKVASLKKLAAKKEPVPE